MLMMKIIYIWRRKLAIFFGIKAAQKDAIKWV